MIEATQKVVQFLAESKETMSPQEFEEFLSMSTSLNLSIFHGLHGDQTYQEFLDAAKANPLSIKLEKGTVQ